MRKLVLLAILLSFFFTSLFSQKKSFVKVEEQEFKIKKNAYRFIGTNYWYGMYLGMANDFGDRARLKRELDELKRLGISNLRVLGSSEGDGKYQITPTLLKKDGSYDKDVLDGLDFFLNELRKRDMKAVVVLNNFWMWSGGMPQYVSWVEGSEIPLPDIENGSSWDPFINYSLKFYSNTEAQQLYLDHLEKLLNHRNKYSKKKYRRDATIMAWQLANEPRGYTNQDTYRNWIKSTATFIDEIDPNHLISVGSEGNTGADYAGIDLYLDNECEAIDYATVHVWIQNWSWYDPSDTATFSLAINKTKNYLSSQIEKAQKLNKPVVIEEFGVSRDKGTYNVDASTHFRNRFYDFVFQYTLSEIESGGLVQGCNFWSWAGEGRSARPGEMWQIGDEYIGDPPHEKQGWYSVYNTDQSTIELIKKYTSLIKERDDE